MTAPKKYVALAAVFMLGAGAMVGVQAHAQNTPSAKAPVAAPAVATPVVAASTDNQSDGETADDSVANAKDNQSDGETADDATVSASAGQHQNDANEAPDAPGSSESESD